MIDRSFVQTMAKYNAWQNNSLYGAADGLGEDARQLDRGAFFGSIHATLAHLLWGDRIWMHRFAGTPEPVAGSIGESTNEIGEWHELKAERRQFDQTIIEWSRELDANWLEGEMSWYSGAAERDITKPVSRLVVHFFNHQTHHRGQVHAMITAAGGKPDDTDLFYMED